MLLVLRWVCFPFGLSGVRMRRARRSASGARLLPGGVLLTKVGEIATERMRLEGTDAAEACYITSGLFAYILRPLEW